jgi:hypothetical protein
MATSFSGGRSQNTRREPPTMGKQLVNFITCGYGIYRKSALNYDDLTVSIQAALMKYDKMS